MKKSFALRASLCGAAVLLAALGGCGGSYVTNVSLGGTITGLTVAGLVLTDNYTTLTVDANATSFKFPTRLNEGLSYSVGVLVQPPLLTCTVTNGYGVITTGDVTNVQVACTPNRSLGGTVKNLKGANLKLANGSDVVSVNPPATAGADVTFTFTNRVAQQANYGVTILKQPDNQVCTVTNGSGTMGATDKTDVLVNCQ